LRRACRGHRLVRRSLSGDDPQSSRPTYLPQSGVGHRGLCRCRKTDAARTSAHLE
jgi:hypothetical protein